MDVLLGFIIIAIFAIPICLWIDKYEKRKRNALFKKVLSGEIKVSPSPESGKIQLVDGVLKYNSTRYGQWEIPIEKLVMIGEMTDANGPYLDDWFLWFLTKDKKQFRASSYADGFQSVVEGLEQVLSSKIELKLTCSTTFDTNILWPQKYAGQSIIKLAKEKRNTFWGRVFKLYDIMESYSELVQAEIDKL